MMLSRTQRTSNNPMLIIGLLLSVSAAANFQIEKYSINNGGGKSTGGAIELHGSVGQSAANHLSQGGNYRQSAGFWSAQSNQSDDIIFVDGFENE